MKNTKRRKLSSALKKKREEKIRQMMEEKGIKIKKVEIKVTPRKIFTVLLTFLMIGWVVNAFFSYVKKNLEIPFSQAITDIKEQKVEEVEIAGDRITLFYQDQGVKITRKESQESLVAILQREGIDPSSIKIRVANQDAAETWMNILINVVPLLLMGWLFYSIFKQAKGTQNSIFSFGKSRAKPFIKGKQSVTFADVAGVEEAKQELREVVDFLKHPGKYRKLGARTPKGVLLVGPPGTGKTLLARAVAGEAGVPFYSMAGSEFMEMLVGVGSARMRDLFETAKKHAPAIIFIDEIESIGRMRSLGGFSGGHDEREQTLNQMLVEMDGFTPNDNVVVIGATNRPDLLDAALLRPGRFDRRIVLDMPDIVGRQAILKIHARGKPFAPEVDWRRVAKRTVGFSGADLENMLNEAAILAARRGKKVIDMEDIEEAATKVKLGPERKRLQSKKEKEVAAYHEGGHALVSHFLPHMDPVSRVSIVARGLTLGHTFIAPARDRTQTTKTRLLEQIAVMLGGRAAEEVVFKEMTVGAADDIRRATELAREMVINFGMSRLGPISFSSRPGEDQWGRLLPMEKASLSSKTQEKIDQEVKRIIARQYALSKEIVAKHRSLLDKLAKNLLKKETLDQDQFEAIVGKKRVLASI